MLTMRDWFEWNGVKSTAKGIYVIDQPPITLPEERVTFTNVPGKAGSLTTVEGDDVYDDMILSANCFTVNPSQILSAASWLKGVGRVTFANRPDGFYEARIVNQIPFETILRGNPHRSFTVNFRCKPFFYLTAGQQPVTVTSGSFLTNPGCVSSEPVINVTGNGDITLMVGMQIIELTDVDDEITIDSVLQEVYSGNGSCNEKMEGDFPLLVPGTNAVSWSGDVTSVVVTPNWRTL